MMTALSSLSLFSVPCKVLSSFRGAQPPISLAFSFRVVAFRPYCTLIPFSLFVLFFSTVIHMPCLCCQVCLVCSGKVTLLE